MRTAPSRLIPLLGLCLLAMSTTGRADTLATSSQGTLARGFALPSLGKTSALEPGADELRIAADLSTEYVLEQADNEELLLDGETQRYSIQYRRGWMEGVDWGVEIPLLHTGGGFMDSVIEDWHDFFGLPDGGRQDAPSNLYQYRYIRDGVTQFDATRSGNSVGDALLTAGWEFRDGWMLRGLVKLPTGDEDKLAGGNSGAAVWTDVALPFDPGSRWGGFVSAGVSANEKADVLEDLQNEVVPFGGVGLDVRLLPGLQALAQIYAHAPLYDDTEIDALQRPGVQLSLGGRWCIGEAHCVELSFQEDLAVASSPDFVLRLAWLAR